MHDVISRQAAIEWCRPEEWGTPDERWRPESEYGAMIEALPTAQQWTPCSERLPEEYGEYRITWITSASGKRLIGDAEFEVTSVWDNEHDRFKGEWLLDDYIKNYPDVEVLAWKPLEEPWMAERRTDEID